MRKCPICHRRLWPWQKEKLAMWHEVCFEVYCDAYVIGATFGYRNGVEAVRTLVSSEEAGIMQ